jgi:hypothetical protein
VYLPSLSPLSSDAALGGILRGGVFGDSSLDIRGNSVLADGKNAYAFMLDLNLGNERAKGAAMALLRLLARSLGAEIRAGEGAHVILDNIVLEGAQVERFF